MTDKAAILKQIADAHFNLAELYHALAESQPAAGAVPPRAPAPADTPPAFDDFEELPTERPAAVQGEGSLAVCPKHKKPFVEGNFGPYCTSPTDDPAWSNKKGYCRITPKNVANYLRMQAA